MQTKQLQVLTLPPWSQYYFLCLTDAIEMPDRHKAPACTKILIATRKELLAFLSLFMLMCLRRHIQEGISQYTNSSPRPEIHLSRSKFSSCLLSFLFHYSLKSYLPSLLPFFIPFTLYIIWWLVWLCRSYVIQREKEIPGWHLHPWMFPRVTLNLDWPDLALGTLALQLGAWSRRPSEVPNIQHFYEPKQTETKKGSETQKGRRKPQSHRSSDVDGLQVYSSTVIF